MYCKRIMQLTREILRICCLLKPPIQSVEYNKKKSVSSQEIAESSSFETFLTHIQGASENLRGCWATLEVPTQFCACYIFPPPTIANIINVSAVAPALHCWF